MVKPTPFEGVIKERSDITPQYGGKPFLFEIALDGGGLAYVLGYDIYYQMDPALKREPGDHCFHDIAAEGMRVKGSYVEWKGMKVVMEIELA